MNRHKRVLFVCSGPGVRARIAEAYARQHASIEPYSSSFEESTGSIPSAMIELMAETGIDLPKEFPILVFDRYKANERYDYVITLCEDKSSVVCPVFRSTVYALYKKKEAKRLSWLIPDFRSLASLGDAQRQAGARVIREQIRGEVESFVKQLSAGKPEEE